MRRPLRMMAFLAPALGLAAFPAARGQVAVQIAPAQAVPAPPGAAGEKKAGGPQAVNVMTFPTDRDAKQMIEAVQQYIAEFAGKEDKAPWDKICFAAQQVLDAKSDSFFEVAKKGEPTGKFHGVSAKAEVNRLIGTFPKTGLQFYQLNYGATAESLLKDATTGGYDRAKLSDVSQRYFHTKAGARATLLLAGFQLDRGNYSEAAYAFERLLGRADAVDLLTPRTTFMAAVALQRAGAGQKETVDKLWEKLGKKFPRDGLTIGRKAYSLEELKQEAGKPFETLFGKVGEAYVATRYGNPSHTAVGDGGAPFLDPAFSHPLNFRTADGDYMEGSTWIAQNLGDVLKNVNPAKGETAIPGFFPVTTQNLVIYRTYDGVYAVITKDGFSNHGTPAKAGDVYWIADAGGSLNQIMGDAEATQPKKWWEEYRQKNQSALLYDNPLTGSLSHDGTNVYFVDDLAVPQPPPVNNGDFGMPVPAAGTPAGSFKGLSDGSKLWAVNIETGKVHWVLGGKVEGPPVTDEDEDEATNPLLLTQGSYFLGPPLTVNGKLYVLFERNGRLRLMCLDPSKVALYGKIAHPELVWSQRIGEPNTRLPIDTARRFQCSYLAYADGVMVCPTNSGAVVAVDVMSRSLLWASSYRFIKAAPQPEEGVKIQRLGRAGFNPAATGAAPLTMDRWRAAAPIIAKGRVVFAAFDCDAVNCLDLRTGQMLWSEPRKQGDLYVGGVVGDRVLIVGKESVRAVQLFGEADAAAAPGGAKEKVRYAWKDVRIGTPAGHGTVSKDGLFYLPLATTPDNPRPEVWAVNVASGKVEAKVPYRKKEVGNEPKPMLGNLVFHEGQLFSQSPTEIAAFPLTELKEREMDRLLKANPSDPNGLATRGELLLGRGKLLEAVADFKAAEANNPPDAVRGRVRDKLYQAYTEILRNDFAAGEKYLAEYERLTEVPLDSDDPNQRQKLADEQFRRKTLFLSLLAKGREKQGRLTEAFDRYREFAALGGGKQLVSIYDEPNGTTRPDVWARGRIEAMMQSAPDAAARKELDARVAAEWDRVKAGQDVTGLREFVKVFGPYFASGREAQLLLAEKLLAANFDDDLREAQAMLLQARVAAEEPAARAKAIDGLARLMTKNGLLDDAVGLYGQLAAGYPDVPVRNGKTGSELFDDLLTDKRYLPYLEPTRVPTPDRVKAEQGPGAAVTASTGHAFEPDGELLPFFRKHRLSLSGNESNNGTWVLRVTDRTTGDERVKFTGLRLFTPNGAPGARVGTANGHLLLLHLGHMAYCFDLAEKKELWQYNLLGESSRVDFNNVQYETTSDNEGTISYLPEGFKIRLGRSSVLQPAYAALLTRDGLVALDPATGAKLWVRSNVAPSAQIFGDAKHIFVVEQEGGDKAKARVLRAVDGAPVEGVADFGPLYAGPARVRMLGRLMLLNEGGLSKPRTVRLYDPLTAKDVWKKEFAADARWVDTLSGTLAAVLEGTGKFVVFDTATGKTEFTGQVDADFFAGVKAKLTKPLLLADADRFYLALNQTPDAGNRRVVYYSTYSPIRTQQITGAVFAFDRATAKRLWYEPALFVNQNLIVEHFAETPALVVATHSQDENTNQSVYRVGVVDKKSGRVRFLKAFNQGGNFYGIQADPRAGAVKFLRNDLSLVLTEDKPAVKK